MKSDDLQQLVEREQLDAHLRGPRGLHVGVVGDDLHAEGRHPLGDQHADPAEADHAEGLLGQLDAGVLGALPLAALERGVGRRDVARGGDQQTAGELGGGDDVGGRGVDDHHAGLGGGGDVDVVQADAGAGDDLAASWRRRWPRRRPWWRERTRIASTSAMAGSSSARSAPSQCRISKSGPSASTVAGDSSSAMRTTGFGWTQCSRESSLVLRADGPVPYGRWQEGGMAAAWKTHDAVSLTRLLRAVYRRRGVSPRACSPESSGSRQSYVRGNALAAPPAGEGAPRPATRRGNGIRPSSSTQLISLRSFLPVVSSRWFSSAFLYSLYFGRPALYSAIQFVGERAVLDLGEDLLHLGLGLVGDDARAGDVVAPLGGLGDRPAHLLQAALVHQVDDQLQLVQALEVRDLRLVAGLDQRLEAGLDQRGRCRRRARPARRTGRSRSPR